ncbi:hypothetical protein CAEBREN_00926 [Caenorhabditis brenneri]|uniref:RING-type domain-containing protein n=1 Tax=Caenorhabditis brenneri TaxID=135651 RepID=G0PM40_CAEBE|nr:hypothetical protein CAEBREN_00926 [Caenorhabditis brenneri]
MVALLESDLQFFLLIIPFQTRDLGFCSKLIEETQLLCSKCVEPEFCGVAATSPPNKTNCPLCVYNDNEIHQPYTGSCRHTICSVCIETTHDGDCPVCGKEGSFEGSQLNKELIREIETIRRNAWEIFKELWNSKAADSGTCSECNKSSSELYLCTINYNNLTIGTNWWKRFTLKSTADVLKLSRQVLCQECASVQADATEKVDSIPFWKNHLKKTNGIFLLELLGDDIGEEENCQSRQVEIHKNRKQLIKKLEELNYEARQECGYDRGLIQLKLIEKLIEHIDRSAKQQQPINEKNCPLCVMIGESSKLS